MFDFIRVIFKIQYYEPTETKLLVDCHSIITHITSTFSQKSDYGLN